MTWIRSTPKGAQLSVRVTPRGSRNEIQGVYGDALKIKLTAPPVEGKANAALIEFLSDALNIPRCSITLRQGMASRTKTVNIIGLTPSQVTQRLGIVS